MNLEAAWKRRLSGSLLVLSLTVVVTVFATVSVPGDFYLGEDWAVFRGAAVRLVHGHTDLYNVDYHPDYVQRLQFFNPPYLAVALLPFAALSERLGWALLSTATLGATIALLRHWTDRVPGRLRVLLVLISPPVIQVILHGQLDALIVASVLLPAQWWPLVISVKPQAAAGLLLAIPRSYWLRASMIMGTVVGISLLVFGLWPRTLYQSLPDVGHGSNLWAHTWPLSGAVGVALAAAGAYRKDERVLVLASPLLFPYALPHTLCGPWIALVALVNRWQGLMLWIAFWGITLIPALS